MKLTFLGTGAAFDSDLPNTSILIESDTKLLLDCGYTSVQKLWQYNDNENFLDAVFISHAHADHYFGLPALLFKMKTRKRNKPLKIICLKGIKEIIQQITSLGFGDKELTFPVEYIEVNEQDTIRLNEFTLNFAPSTHPRPNLAIRIKKNQTFCYSGDGNFTETSTKLFKDADLLIHEAFLWGEPFDGHGYAKAVIKMAKKNGVKRLGLIHIQPRHKEDVYSKVKEFDDYVFIPKPDDQILLK
ncbi:MBL fold metallo-hydrolase [Nanoarchaeota archaeon]